MNNDNVVRQYPITWYDENGEPVGFTLDGRTDLPNWQSAKDGAK